MNPKAIETRAIVPPNGSHGPLAKLTALGDAC